MPLYNPTASAAITTPLVLDSPDYPNETAFWIGKTGGNTRASVTPKHTDLNTLVIASGGGGVEVDKLTATAGDVTASGDVIATGAGSRFRWSNAGAAQTTVGAAGGASALPATPTKFLKVKDSAGTELVIPAYAAS